MVTNDTLSVCHTQVSNFFGVLRDFRVLDPNNNTVLFNYFSGGIAQQNRRRIVHNEGTLDTIGYKIIGKLQNNPCKLFFKNC